MSWFQLDPPSIVSRVRAASASVHPPSLAASIERGTIGFTLVSIAGFIPWAVFGRTLYRSVGETGMYLACALVFVVLSGPAMHRLIIGPGSLARFYKVFSPAFALYSVLWIAGWYVQKGHVGSVIGLIAGTSAMAWVLVTAFDAKGAFLKVTAILFLLNAAGYFIGGVVEAALIREHRLAAMLSWGLFYGLGFGAGLGWAFHAVQREARTLLGSGEPDRPS
jgi:hypothetical protein